jgi:hypothetical protein
MSDNYFQSKSFLRKLAPTDLLRYKTGRASENCEQSRTYHRIFAWPKYIQPRPHKLQYMRLISWIHPRGREHKYLDEFEVKIENGGGGGVQGSNVIIQK